MKAAILILCMLGGAYYSRAQSADALKYAPRAILLLSGQHGIEAVMPMEFTVNGQQHLEFIPSSQIKDAMMVRHGKPIFLGDILSALGEATQTINKLQADNAALKAENEKLWKVAMKNNPSQPPPTVVVQQPPSPPQPSPAQVEAAAREARRQQMIQAWMMLQNRNQPQNYNMHVTVSNCTRYPALCVGR